MNVNSVTNGDNLTTLNDVTLRLVAVHRVDDEAGDRKRLRGVVNSPLSALRGSRLGLLDKSLTERGTQNSVVVILQEGDFDLLIVVILHGDERVAAVGLDVGGGAVLDNRHAVLGNRTVVLPQFTINRGSGIGRQGSAERRTEQHAAINRRRTDERILDVNSHVFPLSKGIEKAPTRTARARKVSADQSLILTPPVN